MFIKSNTVLSHCSGNEVHSSSCIIPPSKTRQRQPVFRLTISEPSVTTNSYELLG